MVALVIFCSNSINILAGVNGLEAGQTLLIACAVLFHNLLALAGPGAPRGHSGRAGNPASQAACARSPVANAYFGATAAAAAAVDPGVRDGHLFSAYLMMPLAATTLGLLHFNWYPSQVRRARWQEGSEPKFLLFLLNALACPVAGVCGRHVHLLCGHGAGGGRHPGPLQRDAAPLLHSAGQQRLCSRRGGSGGEGGSRRRAATLGLPNLPPPPQRLLRRLLSRCSTLSTAYRSCSRSSPVQDTGCPGETAPISPTRGSAFTHFTPCSLPATWGALTTPAGCAGTTPAPACCTPLPTGTLSTWR